MTLAAAIACVLPGRARADALVTLCQSDTQIGPGRNLDEALQDPSPPANNGAYRTITFACPGGAASITMTRQHTITQSTLIDGGGTVTLDGGGTSDMFTAHDPNLRLLFSNLVLRNARAPQSRCGGIFCLGGVVSGVLDLEILSHTRIESSTGPIAISGGNLRIADSTFAGNAVAAVSAGGRVPVSIERSTFQSNGYPLSEVTTVRIVDSNFSNNRLMDLSTCGQVMIDRTSFLNNTTDGALIVGCDTTITGSRFQGNSTAGNGGAVTVTGGARTVTVRSTQFLNNSANGDGGALHLDGSLTNAQTTLVLRHDTFDGNKARNGGAINQATTDKVVSVDATAVVLSHNMSGADGGAIALRGGELQLLDAFVTDNTANGSGGAVAFSGPECIPVGGGNCNRHLFANVLFVRNTAAVAGGAFSGTYATFVNSTVNSNSGPALAFPPTMRATGFSVVRLINTLVSHSSGAGCGPADRAAQYIDGGHNLQFPGNDCGSSIPSKDPQLDSMYIPIPLSPPTSAGDIATCTAFPVSMHDVYSGIRPQGKSCTIGAAEGNIRDKESEKVNFGPDLWNRLKAVLPPGTR